MAFALITGASSGLGAEFARLFARDSYDLILVARRKNRLEEISRALKAMHPGITIVLIEQDLGKAGATHSLWEKVKSYEIEALVNNAGFGNSGAFGSSSLEKEVELIELNIRALVELTWLCLPGMRERKRGCILQVGSLAGFQPGPFMANYYASKAFVNHFSEALSEELRGSGVTCTLLAPGATATEFSEKAGLESSRLFRWGSASAVKVAEAGYAGLKAGHTIVIPGWINKILAQTNRLSPRILARKVAGFLNQNA